MTTTFKNQLIIVVAIFLLVPDEFSAQIITGTVHDSHTSEVVPFANIYFNNSFNGTVSDLNGNFSLNVDPNPGQDIIVSCIGYKSELIEDYTAGEYYKVYLTPVQYMLEPLEIVAPGVSHKKMVKAFKKEFLGRTKNAKKCTIENIEDLYLEYDSITRTLIVSCSQPLIISNNALGYRIKYFLEEFKEDRDNMHYLGYSIFEEDTTLSKREMKKIKKRREKAYLGSRMHFLRALWNDELQASEFTLKDIDTGTHTNLLDNVKIKNEDERYLLSKHPLRITYSKSRVISSISFHGTDRIQFTANGYFNPKGINWHGHMRKQRMGDQLPYEYLLLDSNGR